MTEIQTSNNVKGTLSADELASVPRPKFVPLEVKTVQTSENSQISYLQIPSDGIKSADTLDDLAREMTSDYAESNPTEDSAASSEPSPEGCFSDIRQSSDASEQSVGEHSESFAGESFASESFASESSAQDTEQALLSHVAPSESESSPPEPSLSKPSQLEPEANDVLLGHLGQAKLAERDFLLCPSSKHKPSY